MSYLKYVGVSRYGVSVVLADLKTKVTITKDKPFKLKDHLEDCDRRYYNSLGLCDIILEEDQVNTSAPDSTTGNTQSCDEELLEGITEESSQESKEEEEIIVQDEKVELDITPERLYDELVDTISLDQVNKLAEDLGLKCRKRNKEGKLWELIKQVDPKELLERVTTL